MRKFAHIRFRGRHLVAAVCLTVGVCIAVVCVDVDVCAAVVNVNVVGVNRIGVVWWRIAVGRIDAVVVFRIFQHCKTQLQ
jgi:hypothetical protein